jgi:DinB family protein
MHSSKQAGQTSDSWATFVGAVPSLKSITKNLVRAEKEFLSAANPVPVGQWKTRPTEDRWSAGELVCHLIMVERSVIQGAAKLLQKPAKPRPFFKQFHIPMALVEWRLIRSKSPIPMDPGMICEKEEMLAQLRETREKTLEFIQETSGRDLSKYHMAHPFLGTLNAYEWLQMIASHEVRHTKQMKEVVGSLPKNIPAVEK